MSKRKKIFHIIILCGAAVFSANAAPSHTPNVLDIKQSITDSNIVYPESFEADTQRMLEGWYMKNYTATDDRYRRLPDVETDDNTIRERLAKLPTVIDMPFNPIVRSYIDRYTKKGREQVVGLLGLSLYYMPIFEQALEERGLPLELKYLPVIESALNPNAVSKHGAAGLWQFMLASGKGLGMEVSSLVDERRDPYESSKKAAQLLSDLYATYGDWSLAIAAYNCGPGAVNKAIRRAGGDPKSHDFWSIYNYLSPETRGYYPMFIAANYVMNYYPEHNISPVLPSKPLVTDTIHVSNRVHFNQISQVLQIPVDELRLLNPQFRADLIPGSVDKQYTLVLPSQQVHAYILSENDIRAFEAEKYARRELVSQNTVPAATVPVANEPEDDEPAVAQAPIKEQPIKTQERQEVQPVAQQTPTPTSSRKGMHQVTHKVAPGETIWTIAENYGVAAADIRALNGMRRNSVRVGQMLRINTTVASTPAKKEIKEQIVAESPKSKGKVKETEPVVETPKSKKGKEAAQAETTTSKRNKNKKKQEEARPTSHKLRSGDNLSTLAKKYGVSVDELKKANNMKDDDLRAGDNIKIPAKKSKSSSKSKSSKKRR